MSRLRADLLLLLAAAVWGFGYLFQKLAMTDVGPLTFVAARAAVAALCLGALAVFEARRAPKVLPPVVWRTGLWAGVAFFVAAAVQQAGMVTATVTNTGFLTALYVIVTPLIAWLALRKRPNAVVWPAAILAFVGVWLLGGGGFAALGLGDALVALSAIGWSIHLLIISSVANFNRPVALTALQFVVVAVLSGAAALIFETPSWAAIVAAWPSILFVGVLSSAVTFTILAASLRHTPPSEAAIVVSTETLFAAGAGVIFLGERLPVIGWVGAALMFGAVLLVQLGPALRRGRGATEAI